MQIKTGGWRKGKDGLESGRERAEGGIVPLPPNTSPFTTTDIIILR